MDYKEIITLSNGEREIYEGEWRHRTSDFDRGGDRERGLLSISVMDKVMVMLENGTMI